MKYQRTLRALAALALVLGASFPLASLIETKLAPWAYPPKRPPVKHSVIFGSVGLVDDYSTGWWDAMKEHERWDELQLQQSKPAAPILPKFAPALPDGATGWSSYYADRLTGQPMANGQPYDPAKFTCASWDYDLGTVLTVTSGDKSVRVTVTDRGPSHQLHDQGRVLDLSKVAFLQLSMLEAGVLPVTITVFP